jgi:hypothetical protein
MMICPSSFRGVPSSVRPDPDRPSHHWARISARAAALAGAVVACVLGSGTAGANEQSTPFATACALKETAVITLIEDHAEAQDLPSDRLGEAGLAMLRARLVCYEGRVDEALALYDGILKIGPVVSLRKP